MKKILLSLVTIVMLGSLSGYAQSANRKGPFVELRGGSTMGYVYKSDNLDTWNEYMKGGFDVGLGVGYRFPTSTYWAFQIKADVSCNLSAPGNYIVKLLSPAFLIGMRWTSPDFAGNKSAYIGFGSGVGLNFACFLNVYIPVELELGINLTNRFALGIYIFPQINFENTLDRDYSGDYCEVKFKTNSVIGAKLSYRF